MLELFDSAREFTGLTVITVLFLIAASLLILRNRTVSRQARKAFFWVTIILMCITLIDWFIYITDGSRPELAILHTLLVTATFIVVPAIPVVIANVLLPERHVQWIMLLLLANAALQLANIFGGFIFWVDETNTYHRGFLYILYMAIYTFTALYLVIESIRAARAFQAGFFTGIFGILVCMFAGVIIQIVDSNVRMTWPAVSMAVVLYFMFYSDMILRSDALTKLLNRRSFDDALAKPPLPCVIVIIDVNDFKSVNDTYGHSFGDECLQRVAVGIRRYFGSSGYCYRTGGDEFAVIMTKRLDEVEAIANELREAGVRAREEDDRIPTVSVGYATASEHGLSIKEALQAADESMYDMKRR